MSESIVVVLQNLLSFPMDDMGLVWSFNKDLKKLKQSLITVRDFLEDAETKQATDQPLQRWLMKLQVVVFLADNVFDELNYHVLRRKVKGADNQEKNKVSAFFSNSNPIVLRYKMARKTKGLNKKLKAINRKAIELGLGKRIAGAGGGGAQTEAPTYMEADLLHHQVFVGRENDVTEIVEMLTSSQVDQAVLSVLPIVGNGGLGKTMLSLGVLFNDAKVISHFEERAYVLVSEIFDPLVVLIKFLETLTLEFNVDGNEDVVLRKLREKIGDKRYLLVLDDVWNEDGDKWEKLITSLEGIGAVNGNVIMVTTSKRSVASIVKTLDIHELSVLSEGDCWTIIKAKAFGGEGVSPEFEIIGANIAQRCGGSPLAAEILGSLLRGKSEDEWTSFERKCFSDLGGDENTVSKILKLSFDNLPSPSMKKCFALCSITPKGWMIEKDEIIDLWMAEGFLQTDDQEKDMETVGNEVYQALVQRSLLQVMYNIDDGDADQFTMHGLVHDLSSSVSSHVNESSPIPKQLAKYLRSLFFKGKASQIKLSNFKYLHILILVDKDSKELPVEIGKLISLRYLDISHTRIECLPDSIGDLYHLQTLRATIKYGKQCYLRKLPDTFEFLINLRHLYIPKMKMPPRIGKLIALQTLPYFQVGDEDGCGIMELGSLSNLKGELEIDNLEKVRDKHEAKSADLLHKPNILRLRLVWKESTEGESDNHHESVLEGLQPPSNLERLEINGFKGKKFPLWTLRMAVREDLESRWVKLDNLIMIKLSNCTQCEEIPMLGHLPHLKYLYLHHLSNVKSLGSSFYGIEENEVYKENIIVFPVLRTLDLYAMPNLIAWEEVEWQSSSDLSQPCEVSMFGLLEHLVINKCEKLMSAPTHFPCLKQLEIYDVESDLPLAKICGSKLTSLTKLSIQSIDGLVSLPDELFYRNRDLAELDISYCKNLTHLVPCLGGGGSSLRSLLINSCREFAELPEDIHSLNALEELKIFACQNFKLPYPNNGDLSSQGGFTSLRILQISFCNSVGSLPIQMLESCTSSLESLLLKGSKGIYNLPEVVNFLPKMPCLQFLTIQQVPKSSTPATKIEHVRSLVGLGIGGSPDCWGFESFKASLDRILPALSSLRELSLFGRDNWRALPDQLQHLTTLQELVLDEFGIEALPEWLQKLSSLKVLRLYNCGYLRHFPSKEAMHGLTKLTSIHIDNCIHLAFQLKERATGNSEWAKISHISNIMVDGNLISSPH